ncbi:hypothetical protein L293_2370 [Acinetobacter gyllenbergii CIP 110306 = MTCC 11365]|nr:hypothetical protein L293_2370 [Acinetobacter gyllenbergii CIP 110306 = MTCC 11365]
MFNETGLEMLKLSTRKFKGLIHAIDSFSSFLWFRNLQ